MIVNMTDPGFNLSGSLNNVLRRHSFVELDSNMGQKSWLCSSLLRTGIYLNGGNVYVSDFCPVNYHLIMDGLEDQIIERE